MRYHVLAADYDGTLATHGQVPDTTIAAVRRLRGSGRKLILVTGRQIDELLQIFPDAALCNRIVAENGAVIYNPTSKETRALAEPPPPAFAAELARRIGQPVAVGHVIVATWQPHEAVALELINETGLELQIVFNKGAVMILPSGINKAVGLVAALDELGLSARNTVGVGDAENDHAFLAICECAVAVANALPPLKGRADVVTGGAHSDGVTELIEQILRDDLQSLESYLTRHEIPIGRDLEGKPVTLSPYRPPVLFAGSSGGGKSTMATVLIEALTERGYQTCIIDPEGDFRDLPGTRVLGDAQRPPATSEVMALLEGSNQNLSVSLIALPFADRAPTFESLLPHLLELRARTGRPQWIVVDEAHHVAPDGRTGSGLSLPAAPHGMVYITVHPGHVSKDLLGPVDAAVLLGSQAPAALRELTEAQDVDPAPRQTPTPPPGQALLWRRQDPRNVLLFEPATPQSERRRHVRKYATGALEPQKSFFFRGPDKKLNLRAHNLGLFVQIADGVDDETWLFHLHAGDYSSWFHDAIRDPELADEARHIEAETGLSAQQSRERIRAAIESRYTAAA
jgi:hydroxymethylpyrimidine pyrophosphatase-like HAD family hydrolase